MEFPKPPKKQKKKQRYIKVKKQPKRAPSVIQRGEKSYMSNRTEGLERHEPICGQNRRMSMAEGLWIYLTHEEHEYMKTPEGIKLNDKFKSIMQAMWFYNKSIEGYTWNETMSEWMGKFGKNYL